MLIHNVVIKCKMQSSKPPREFHNLFNCINVCLVEIISEKCKKCKLVASSYLFLLIGAQLEKLQFSGYVLLWKRKIPFWTLFRFVSFPKCGGNRIVFFFRLRTLVSGYKMFFLSLSDGTSLGYISGQGSDPPLPNASAGLVETCDFLAALAPNRKKTSLEFDKQSTYSVCVSTSSSEGRGPYRSGFSLPHIFVYVGWFGCLLTSAIAALFTIWYGVR